MEEFNDNMLIDDNLHNNFSEDKNKFNKKIGQQGTLHPFLNPKRWFKNKETTLSQISTYSRCPIVFGLDVTGSMTEWAKIIFEKFPMFYGQLIQQKYIEDFSVSFSAIGDSDWSIAPLQVSTFSQGVEIDDQIKKLFLEGGGGGNGMESYELFAYFYLNKVSLENSQFPFLFFTGDEIFFDKITSKALRNVFGMDIDDSQFSEIDTIEIFKNLCKKYNVFHIRKSYGDKKIEKNMLKKWTEAIGKERILDIENPRACIDVILGAISLTSGSRNLEGYIEDMKNRGQTKERIKEVTRALILYNSRLNTGKLTPIINEFKCKNFEDEFGNVLIEEIEEPNKTEVFNLLEEFKKNVIATTLNEDDLNKQKTVNKIMKDIPNELFCPITGDLFKDPVLTEDGQTYEKSAIEKWFKSGYLKSPLSGVKLNTSQLIPNKSIKNLVEYHRQKIFDN